MLYYQSVSPNKIYSRIWQTMVNMCSIKIHIRYLKLFTLDKKLKTNRKRLSPTGDLFTLISSKKWRLELTSLDEGWSSLPGAATGLGSLPQHIVPKRGEVVTTPILVSKDISILMWIATPRLHHLGSGLSIMS